MNTDTVMNNETTTTATTATTTTANGATVAVKVIRGEEVRRFNYQGRSFLELKEVIAQLFDIPSAEFTLQYEDDEKDRVTLSTDEELKEAIQLHKYILRFFVAGTKSSDLPSGLPSPHHYPHSHHHHPHHHHHHGHHRGVASPPPHVVAAEGEVISSPPFGSHGHGRHGHAHHPHPYGGYGGRYHKRCMEKEDKEAMKCERKRWKKQRKCESSSSSSSSSSSEDEAQKKVQRKEMRQLIKATKISIEAAWAPTKQANPAQWHVNKKMMLHEIKLAKRLIREQTLPCYTPASAPAPVAAVVVNEQDESAAATTTTAAAGSSDMQA